MATRRERGIREPRARRGLLVLALCVASALITIPLDRIQVMLASREDTRDGFASFDSPILSGKGGVTMVRRTVVPALIRSGPQPAAFCIFMTT